MESYLFCILEELSYIVSETVFSIFDHYHLSVSSSTHLTRFTNHIEMVTATVKGVCDDAANLVTLSFTKADGITAYRWNEAVVLVSPVNLASISSSASLPHLVLGIINNTDSSSAANKNEWTLAVHMTKEMKKILAISNTIFLYSLTTFTSYLR